MASLAIRMVQNRGDLSFLAKTCRAHFRILQSVIPADSHSLGDCGVSAPLFDRPLAETRHSALDFKYPSQQSYNPDCQKGPLARRIGGRIPHRGARPPACASLLRIPAKRPPRRASRGRRLSATRLSGGCGVAGRRLQIADLVCDFDSRF
jgi:hypothetical protein